ncbi:MAG TPA: Rieske 2Fe-2S domain-containing protein [Holophagaceae bacterium]|nr:Rieske 2Fe-2S domain-containing protein [Holophagaceae bacterium]
MPKSFWRRAFPLDLHEESRYSRREFARFLAVVSAGFTAGIGYLWGRKRPLEGAPDEAARPESVALEGAADLQPGQSKLFTFRDADDRCILLRTPEGQLRAFRQTCTHLGCAVRFDGQRLECPCHMGFFEPDKGFPVQGPPTRPLAGIALATDAEGRVHAVGDIPKPSEFGKKEA